MMKEINKMAEAVLGWKRKRKQVWVMEDTLRLCDRRRDLKKQEFKNANCAENYRVANGNVRRELSMDKERWIKNQCEVIESNLLKGNAREAYKVVKCLTKTHQARVIIIEAKYGKLLAKTVAVAERWKE